MNPDPTNEELWAWSATEIMGWRKELLAGGWAYLKTKPDDSVVTCADDDIAAWAEDWHPTAEGSEHQAMMVEDKMFQLGWACALEGPIPGDANYLHTATFWWARTKDRDEEFTAVEPTRGHATVLAAWRAAKGER